MLINMLDNWRRSDKLIISEQRGGDLYIYIVIKLVFILFIVFS